MDANRRKRTGTHIKADANARYAHLLSGPESTTSANNNKKREEDGFNRSTWNGKKLIWDRLGQNTLGFIFFVAHRQQDFAHLLDITQVHKSPICAQSPTTHQRTHCIQIHLTCFSGWPGTSHVPQRQVLSMRPAPTAQLFDRWQDVRQTSASNVRMQLIR